MEDQEYEEAEAQPRWLKELRAKARAYDHVMPQLQRDMAILKGNVDEQHSSFPIWERDFSARVRAGQAAWDVDQVAADASQYGLIREERPDYSVDAAGFNRITDAASGAQVIDRQATAHERMRSARTIEELTAAYQAAGGSVIHE